MRTTSSRIRLVAAFILCASLPVLAFAERRVALVIGNGNYATVKKLANPANDAEDVAAKLRGLGFSVTKLVDAKLGDMLKAQRDFAVSSAGVGMRLFYYAGHGVQAQGENWLLPVDADVKDDYELRAKALSAQLVLDGLKAAGPGVNIVVLDACRNNPFKAASRSAGASRGLAVMGTSGSLIVYATGPGAAAADGDGRNGIFTGALLARLDSPGLSLQEIMTNVAADVAAATKGAQEPWKQDNLTKMVYFVTPEEAQAQFAQRLEKGRRELASLDAQLAGLKEQVGAERDAAKKQAIELEIKKQEAFQAQKRQEDEALSAERERQAQAEKNQAAMAAQLASYKAEAASREEVLRQAAEAKRRELEAVKAEGSGALPYLFSIESARKARNELGAQYDASLATVRGAVTRSYDEKLGALAGWAEEPWENAAEFKSRVQAERARLESQKRAALEEARAANAGKRADALAPFEEAEKRALVGLEAARSIYAGAKVRVMVGAFDKNEKCFPIAIDSMVPELPYRAAFRYSIKSGTAEELKRKYLEFEAWQKAGALFAEIEASVLAIGEAGFANQVEALRLKAAGVGGDRVLFEDKPGKPVSIFAGSDDRQKSRPITQALVVRAPGAALVLDGKEAGRDRALLLEPKPGIHSAKAILADGTVLEERRNVVAGSVEAVTFETTGSVEVFARAAGELWVDGAKLGSVTPASPFLAERLAPGSRTFVLRYAGLPSETLQINVRPQERVKVSFRTDPEFVLVPAGSFTMGVPEGEEGWESWEPPHSVTLSAFLMGTYEVTQAEWIAVMGKNPSLEKGDSLPVEQVNWYDCLAYCNKRSMREGLKPCYSIGGSSDPARWGFVPSVSSAIWNAANCDFGASGYRLPTEAEWEYAAKGGPVAAGLAKAAIFAGQADFRRVGWVKANSGGDSHPVGQKEANVLGLYDLVGNVDEWCWDWFGGYPSSTVTDPTGAASGTRRIIRGSSYLDESPQARSAERRAMDPEYQGCSIGLRLVRGAPSLAESGASANATAAVVAPSLAAERTIALSDFVSFLGFSPGDSIDAAFARIGSPTRQDPNKKYSFGDCYWDALGERALNLSFDKKTRRIMVLRVNAADVNRPELTREYFLDRGMRDPALEFLGKSRDEIMARFGKPDGISSNNYEYERKIGGLDIGITFVCYDFRGYLCDEIVVRWY